jgi:hypothetical protein
VADDLLALAAELEAAGVPDVAPTRSPAPPPPASTPADDELAARAAAATAFWRDGLAGARARFEGRTP